MGHRHARKAGPAAPRPVRLADGREFAVRMADGVPVVDWTGLVRKHEPIGFKPLSLTMPADGYVSLVIRDAGGTVVRQLLACEPLAKGDHELKWDGLTTPNWRVPGEPVPPGKYSWSAISHTGIGLRLVGWADNAGQTPWDFPAGTGNWGGDHGAPTAAAADADHVYLAWGAAEAGKALLACDTKGNVEWGNTHGGIAGAQLVAADGGTVYVLRDSEPNSDKRVVLYRLSAKDGAYTSWQGTDSTDLEILTPDGLAAQGGKLFLSYTKAGAIKVLDGATGREEASLEVPAPTSLKVVSPHSAYVISGGNKVVNLVFGTGRNNPRPPIEGLSAARGLAVAADGKIYVGDNGPDHQVNVFAADGKPLAPIGRKGGRAATGPWVADALGNIADLTIDARGQLWIVESDMTPKRISTWDPASGKLLAEFFGPSGYGALGGAIDPADPHVMVGQGCAWRLDPQTGRARCTAVITRDGMEVSRFASGPDGRVYLAVAANWAFNVGPLKIYERVAEADYKLRTVIFYADQDGHELPAAGHGQPSGAKQTMVWGDANGDGQRQADEIRGTGMPDGKPVELRFSGWYMGLMPDLTLYSGDKQFKPSGFSPCGAPRYDLTRPVTMPAAGLGSADGRLVLQSGEYGVDHGWTNCYDIASGQLKWRYPDTFVGVHGSHNAPPAETGLVRGSFPPCGAVQLPPPVGNVWAIPTNVGEWHLLTGEGYYLTRLFQPDPLRIEWPAAAVPGANLDNAPPGMGGEDFGGSITLARDGKLYLQAGKTAFWNIEVVGLDSVRELARGELTIAQMDIPLAEKLREDQLQQTAARQQLVVKRLSPKFTGHLEEDFRGATLVRYQKQPDAAVRSAIAWDTDYLYLGWEVGDATPWVNGATDAEMLYLGGDTVDFQLGVDPQADKDRSEAALGDLRLSIGNFQGTPQAVIYRRLAQKKHPRHVQLGRRQAVCDGERGAGRRRQNRSPQDGQTIHRRGRGAAGAVGSETGRRIAAARRFRRDAWRSGRTPHPAAHILDQPAHRHRRRRRVRVADGTEELGATAVPVIAGRGTGAFGGWPGDDRGPLRAKTFRFFARL